MVAPAKFEKAWREGISPGAREHPDLFRTRGFAGRGGDGALPYPGAAYGALLGWVLGRVSSRLQSIDFSVMRRNHRDGISML